MRFDVERHTRHEYLMDRGASGKITPEEAEEYRKEYMTLAEKSMGKPIYKMDDYDFRKYKMIVFNTEGGTEGSRACLKCHGKGRYQIIKDDYVFTIDCECVKEKNL